ncbi:Glycosyl transferases group 1 [Nakamurella panacisegetis]|uniref:Glycosyl transferases group 1 n=1 Tax=Nakamurella panacisegetis TaxID=1090615 RepID=A0A1H0PHX3_9ACTN|nr:glycosyltransferase family 1 protein [Nakamurella panacisegetis]SDP04594.1 Glycosyl transferases group 1 [Nakamurella panacisegetis]
MTAPDLATAAQAALAGRLRAVTPILAGTSGPDTAADPAVDAAILFEIVVSAVEDDLTDERVWLLMAALSAILPTRAEVDATRRRFQLDSAIDLRMHLLDTALARVQAAGTATTGIEVVVGEVLVDVDHSAKHDLHTGIQRVTRNLLPRWDTERSIVPVVWSLDNTALRRLSPAETSRVIRWGTVTPTTAATIDVAEPVTAEPPAVVVPWRSVVVLVEVPPGPANDRLAAIGSKSTNALVGIAYDVIPIVSADAVPPVESMKFARYLTAVKFASRMAGISAAATAEMRGFARMLPTQGLTGPVVSEVSLPAAGRQDPSARDSSRRDARVPMVLSVGSHEPRKNHLAILFAAERLWREGLAFSLQFIGGSGWGDEFPRVAADLKAAGRPLEVRKGVSDRDLNRALTDALFTVFPSLHEGYGLPVAESMAHGTPVITSDFGSMAEIAADGGAVTIDPRDDEQLVAAMRSLLTDPDRINRLRQEIADRPERGWAEYADELWAALVEPELARCTVAAADSRRMEGTR